MESWGKKFDPYSRMKMEDGLPASGIDVTVRLAGRDEDISLVERAGLELHAQVGDILVGHVASTADLKQIAELDCVQEVQVSRALYDERPESPGRED